MAGISRAGCAVILTIVILCVLGPILGYVIFESTRHTYVTVSLVSARGLDVDDQATPVKFDVAIGFRYLGRDRAATHDGGNVTISYAGIKLAEGPVPKFYVAGDGTEWVEATRAVASAGKDQAPLSQLFRDHLWVEQQLYGVADFDIVLSFFDVNITSGVTKSSYHNCNVGLALQGDEAGFGNCGRPASLLHRYRY